jgi:hypothetical protein
LAPITFLVVEKPKSYDLLALPGLFLASRISGLGTLGDLAFVFLEIGEAVLVGRVRCRGAEMEAAEDLRDSADMDFRIERKSEPTDARGVLLAEPESRRSCSLSVLSTMCIAGTGEA